jgi:DDE superfamily endonuclease
MLDIQPCDIYNVDQTNIYYSMESSYTLAPKGSRTVSIKGCNSNKRCSVMLGASLSGGRLPPYIVFDGKAEGRIHRELISRKGYPDNIQLAVQESAWFDERIMLDWIEKVWRPFAVTGEKIYYLLLDNCPAHCTFKVKDAFSRCRTEIDYVPRGYTSRLQVMDVGVNKPFKHYARNKFDDWMVENDNKKPTRQDVSWWVAAAWDDIKDDTFAQSWRRAMDLSSSYNDVLLDNSNDNNSQNTQQSDISVGDPLLFDAWDCGTSSDDDGSSNELILEIDGNNNDLES